MALLELLNGFVYDPRGIRSGILNYSSILSLASMTLVSFEVTSWAHTSASLMVDLCNIAHCGGRGYSLRRSVIGKTLNSSFS